MSIRAKYILILAFSLSAVALGILSAVRFLVSEEAETAFARHAAMHMDRVDDIVQAYFAIGSEAVKTLAALPEASDGKLYADADGTKATAVSEPLRRFASFRALIPGAEAVFCGYKNGLLLAVPEGGAVPGENAGGDIRKCAWYADAVLGTAPVAVTDAYISTVTKSLAVTVSTRIKNPSGETIGVAAANISLAALADALRDIQMGKDGYLVIFDARGRIILDPAAQENVLQPAQGSRDAALEFMAQLPAGAHTLMRDGKEYAAYARPLATAGWKAVILMDAGVFGDAADSLTRNVAVAALAILCLVFIFGSLAAIGAARPLQALVRQSAALADGNIEALEAIPGRGPDITALHSNLGRLTGRVMLLLQAEKERRDEAGSAPASAAENQPHAMPLKETLRVALQEGRSKTMAALGPIADGLAAATAALAAASADAMREAEMQLSAANETRAAAMAALNDTATLARQAAETEANVDASLALTADIGTRCNDAARGIEGAEHVVLSLAGTLEHMKTDIAEMGELVSLVRDIAEQTNLLAFNVSLDANSAGSGEKDLTAVAEKIRAIAENAMTLTGAAEAVTVSLEQSRASQVQSLTKTLSALQRAAAGNGKAADAASGALAGLATTAEQFRVLATALEGAAETGEANAEHLDALARASRNVSALLREIGDAARPLTALSTQLAAMAGKTDGKGGNPACGQVMDAARRAAKKSLD